MRQRILPATFNAAALVALFLADGGFATQFATAVEPESAMPRIKSFRADYFFESTFTDQLGRIQVVIPEGRGKHYWLAPDRYRYDFRNGREVDIYFADRHGIFLDHDRKTFSRALSLTTGETPYLRLNVLGGYTGGAERDLGNRLFDGRDARGYEFEMTSFYPHLRPGPLEVWLDRVTNAPLYVKYESHHMGITTIERFENFEWNVDLDPRLFAAEPPAGYATFDKEPNSPPIEQLVSETIASFKLYLQLGKDHYPRVDKIYSDPIGIEMSELAGLTTWTFTGPRGELEGKVVEAANGFWNVEEILTRNPDARYYGRTVGPLDKEKVLLRWRLDDGKYQVLYGDLSAEQVTAKGLAEREGK